MLSRIWHFFGLSDYFRSTIITTLKKFKLAEREGAGDEDLGLWEAFMMHENK